MSASVTKAGTTEKTKYKKSLGTEIRKNASSYVLLAPFFLIFIIFTIIPVIVSIGMSFTSYNVLEAPTFVGLDNFRRLFVQDEIFGKAIRNTLIFAVFTGPFGYFISFFASWAINELNRYLKAILTFIFYVPTISGTVYTIWGIIFSGDMYGYANSFLLRMGFINEPIQYFTTESYILPLIIVIQLWMSLGTGFLMMRAGISTVDQNLYEAAAIDGIKNRVQELIYVTVPMMAPHLMTAAVLQITGMFSNAGVSEALFGLPSTNYAGHLIMNHLNDYANLRVERGYASAIAVILFIFMIGMNSLILKAIKKVGV